MGAPVDNADGRLNLLLMSSFIEHRIDWIEK